MREYTQADLEGLLRRLFPEDFIGPMLDGTVPGGEPFAAAAAVFARLSQAVVRLNDGLCPLVATIGNVGTGTIALTRTNANGAPAGTLYAGTIHHDVYHNRVVQTADVTWGAGDLVVKTGVAARSWNRSWKANLAPQTPIAILSPVCKDGSGNPAPLFDTTITGTVESLTGATPPDLELLGSFRRKVRAPSEPVAAFRDRIATVTGRIDPNSILAAARTVRADTLYFEGADLCAYAGHDDMTDAQAARIGTAYTGGSLDLLAPDRAPRYSDYPQGFFILYVPGAAMTEDEAQTMWSKVHDAVGAGVRWWIEEQWYYTH